jgi:hypothetical protein
MIATDLGTITRVQGVGFSSPKTWVVTVEVPFFMFSLIWTMQEQHAYVCSSFSMELCNLQQETFIFTLYTSANAI